MTELVLKAARELGIESKIHVREDQQPIPLVSVIEGTQVVQSRIDTRWFMDVDPAHVKTILADMQRIASALARNN